MHSYCVFYCHCLLSTQCTFMEVSSFSPFELVIYLWPYSKKQVWVIIILLFSTLLKYNISSCFFFLIQFSEGNTYIWSDCLDYSLLVLPKCIESSSQVTCQLFWMLCHCSTKDKSFISTHLQATEVRFINQKLTVPPFLLLQSTAFTTSHL